jgi:ubiquinone biosynthesis protein UbiJ
MIRLRFEHILGALRADNAERLAATAGGVAAGVHGHDERDARGSLAHAAATTSW